MKVKKHKEYKVKNNNKASTEYLLLGTQYLC